MDWLRPAIYANIVASFVVTAALDWSWGEWKLGTVSLVFALANGLIFFWR